MSPRLLSPFSLLFSFLLLAAGTAQAEVRVLTSIKPLQLIAAAVQDGVGEPEALLPPGASPHHYALRPSDMRRVQEVDLLYWICLLYTSPSPRDRQKSRMPSSA